MPETPRVGIFDDPVFEEHDAGPGNPERAERLDAVREGLRRARLADLLEPGAARDASREELLAVHTAAHVDRVAETEGRGGFFDFDTVASPRSYGAAVRAAGAVAAAVDAVLEETLDRAFCLVRPPGHHATSDRAMGFCYFNNVAVGAARALARGLERVAILDFDVHHGNGTQEIFWGERRVLFISSHRYPFYPGTGALDEVGEGEGRGFSVNLPLAAGLGDADHARVWREIAAPIGRAFDPELVLVSAGFDGHEDDPLGGMALTADGYAAMADVCVTLAGGAAGGRVVAVLEGGYGPTGLGDGSAALVSRLLDRPTPEVPRAHDERTEALLAAYRRAQVPFWPTVEPAR
jgi:acetoin utilization deacetylase AcuC-like enzyme